MLGGVGGRAMIIVRLVGALVLLGWMAFIARQSWLAKHYAEISCISSLEIQRQMNIIGQAGMPDLLGKIKKPDVVPHCN